MTGEDRHVGTVVVGGGISGAAVLHRLASRGADVILLERNEKLGGVIGSRRNGLGALVEAGPNSTQLGSAPLAELIDELGIRDLMLEADRAAAKRYIVRGGKPVRTPSSPGTFLGTQLFSMRAKLRLLREPFVPPGPPDADESVAAFVERRLGREILDYAVNPFVSGIYAGRPELLSLRHAFPRLHALESRYGSLLKGMLKGRPNGPRAARPLISFIDGMGTMPEAIEKRWKDRIQTSTSVLGISRTASGWKIDTGSGRYTADRVVVAVDAGAAAALLEPTDADLAAALRRIVYPPVATVVSVYNRTAIRHPLDGFGMLAPEVEKRSILGVIFSSSIFPGRAPEGLVVLTTFVGGARTPQLALNSREEIEELVHAEHAALLGATAAPASSDVTVRPRAIPQYAIGHGAIMDAIDRAEANAPGLHLLGNYRGGVSVADCVGSAWKLVDRITTD